VKRSEGHTFHGHPCVGLTFEQARIQFKTLKYGFLPYSGHFSRPAEPHEPPRQHFPNYFAFLAEFLHEFLFVLPSSRRIFYI